MDLNLNELSLKELKELHAQVLKAINSYEDRRKKEAISELETRARAMGFSLAELTGAAPAARKRAPSASKFANPDNADETWSGRGRKPRWFEAALAAGLTAEDMSV